MSLPDTQEARNSTWNDLPQLIADSFSLLELRSLCFHLNVRYEDLGENIGLLARAVELVTYMERHGRSDELVEYLQEMRPHVKWPSSPKKAISPFSVKDRYSWQRWLRAGVVGIVITAVIVLLLQSRSQPIIPMGAGFNIAVAQFTAFDEVGHESVTEASATMSNWLFATLQDNKSFMPSNLQIELRGPSDIGPVEGALPQAREASAAEIAHLHNATVVIYGSVTGSQNPYLLNIDFYVSELAFEFGSEIVGPERLGKPVTFALPLTPASLTAVNAQLQTRVDILQDVVNGLSNLFILDYERARLDFSDALNVPNSSQTEGHEVVYMLLGATALEAYDHVAHPDFLSVAEENFALSRQRGPQYSRAFLGLGAVALEQAKVIDPDTGDTIAINADKLVDAQGLYQTSLVADDQPAKAYIEAKAYYGLGQAHLLGWGFGITGWSGAQAQMHFDQVLQIYEQAGFPAHLTVLVAHTHGNLGILAGHNGDWEKMIQEVHSAIDLLESINNPEANDWIARYWTWAAEAEIEINQLDNARRSYERALDRGSGYVDANEYQKWQNTLNELGG